MTKNCYFETRGAILRPYCFASTPLACGIFGAERGIAAVSQSSSRAPEKRKYDVFKNNELGKKLFRDVGGILWPSCFAGRMVFLEQKEEAQLSGRGRLERLKKGKRAC